jgi:preprotein translocase subunit SecA
LQKILGVGGGRRDRRYGAQVAQINAWEDELREDSDDELRARLDEIRATGAIDYTDSERALCFALVREAARRSLGLRHFDVQLVGGLAMAEGAIAEMQTGEGKTLTSTLPIVFHALAGKGVHVVTANDYLARRDAAWMLPIYELLGLSVGVIEPEQDPVLKQAAYAADITYGTNAEFGFDYLRDNLAWSTEQQVTRPPYAAVIDEIDNILIDEARTPLIVSGDPAAEDARYLQFAAVAPKLVGAARPTGVSHAELQTWLAEVDYEIDEKHKTVAVTERGATRVEKLLGLEGLYRAENASLVNHLVQSLRAAALYQRDRDYVVIEREVHIIDENTGRVMPGRRWSEGLHQAVEAKEGLDVQADNPTVASITYQNFFRRYPRLSGMTGTAMTEASEFQNIYGLQTVAVPPNVPTRRVDYPDVVFATTEGKWKALVRDAEIYHKTGQPVLIGTVSVEDSESLSKALRRAGLQHTLLNARPEYAEQEGQTIAQAGRRGAITIATNMAGRGVDIKLGGDARLLAEERARQNGVELESEAWEALLAETIATTEAEGELVRAGGGLVVLGTERHESRRIDNQLRGRSGRQGDPGMTQFYLSADDTLLRVFGGQWIKQTILSLSGGVDRPVEHRLLSKRIESAQRKVEEQRYLERKQVIEYDDVVNEQRGLLYEWRQALLEDADMRERVQERLHERVAAAVAEYTNGFYDAWDLDGPATRVRALWPSELELAQYDNPDDMTAALVAEARALYAAREAEIGDAMRQFERMALMQALDDRWREHLHDIEYLREAIHLRGFAQVEPLVAYQHESHELFEEALNDIWNRSLSLLFYAEFEVRRTVDALAAAHQPVAGAPEPTPAPSNRQQRRAAARAGKRAQ